MTRNQQIKWAEALESGKYRQVVGGWYEIEEGLPHYSCLTVFAEVVLGKDINKDPNWDDLKEDLTVHGIHVLTYMDFNDNSGLSFEEIAERIRAGDKLRIEENICGDDMG